MSAAAWPACGRAATETSRYAECASLPPFGVTGLDRFGVDHVAHEVVGRSRDQDLEGRGILLHRRGDHHRVAGQDVLADAGLAEGDLAGGDPGPDDQADVPGLFEPVVQGGQRALGLRGRFDRAQGVVIVTHREPEDGDDRVADDLLDRAAMRLEDQPHLIEIEGQHLAKRLWIEALAERRRTLEVGVHDGREAPDLDRPARGFPRRPTRSAEPISLRDRGAAA